MFGIWRNVARAILSVMAAVLVLGVTGGQAQAGPVPDAFDIVPGSFTAGTFDEYGEPETQAGAHPFRATTNFDFTAEGGQALGPSTPGYVDAYARDMRFKLPPGFVGNPEAAPKCPRGDFADLAADPGGGRGCPPASQVGIAEVRVRTNGTAPTNSLNIVPVYLLESPDGTTAQLGFPVLFVPVTLNATVDTEGDYGLDVTVKDASQGLPPSGVTLTLWGQPWAPAHDRERFCGKPAPLSGIPCPVTGPEKPFLTNPATCDVSQVSTMSVESWERPGVIRRASFEAPKIRGCDKLRFTPGFKASTDTRVADSATGLGVKLELPQADDEQTGLAPPALRDATVTLPEGLTINPGSANGLDACTDAQLGLKSNAPVACPNASKIGTVSAETPVLPEPLIGSVYLRTQNSSDPQSGEMFRLALVLESEKRGLLVKLPGRVHADPATGRLRAVFADNPQLPVSSIDLAFKSGPRAPLAMPWTCGQKSIDADLTSWGGQSVAVPSPIDVDCSAGLGAFAPTFEAGTTQPVGGSSSPFELSMQKPDGNSALTGLRMELPTGLLANLKGNIGSQIGTVKTFAGPGSSPFMLPGSVYLEGAYDDAPFSLRVVVPAKAGPFDLGEVVVRQKIYVNPDNAQVTVVSDPIPTIVKGVPVRLQRLDVNVDKPGFMINPTSCAAKEIKGTLASVVGQTAALTNRFQVGDCSSLGYTPKLAMTMSGKGQTKDGSHPTLAARLTPPAGDANNKKVTVTLPLSLALDPGNANGLCEPKDAAANKCPANTVVGSAQAQSILPDTLKGPVYFVRGERIENGKVRKTLPKLFIPLTANGVTVNVWGDSDVEDDRLVTTFNNLPDAPFSTFDLKINGGKHGILAVSSANTCAATQIADAEFGGQNGKAYTSKVTMGTPCALGVVKSSHTSTALKLTVGGLGAGKVSASGNGVAKASKTLTSATTATLSLKLSKATRRALARGRDIKVRVKVAFAAKGQKKAKTATKTVVLHGAKKR